MNQKAIIVVFMCVATGAAAAGFFGPSKPDFGALNEYLATNLLNDKDLDRNLNLIREKINTMKGGIKEAAKVVLELAASNGECDQRHFDILKMIEDSGFGSIGMNRIEKVLGPLMIKASQKCPAVVDQQVEEASRALPASLAQFATKIAPSYGPGEDMDDDVRRSLEWDAHSYFIKFDEVVKVFYNFTDRSIKYLKDEQERRAKATAIFENQIVKPCEEIVTALSGPFERARYSYNVGWTRKTYVSERSTQFKNLAWTYRFCQIVASKPKSYKGIIIDALNL